MSVRFPRIARGALLTAVLVAMCVIAANELAGHYPIHQWLFWRYAGAAAIAAIWFVACLGMGLLGLGRLVPAGRLLPLERIVLGFGLGALAFCLVMFALGILRLWGTITFFLVPSLFLIVGAPALFSLIRRRRRRLPAWKYPLEQKVSALSALLFLAGTIGVAFLYGMILDPANVAYDSRW